MPGLPKINPEPEESFISVTGSGTVMAEMEGAYAVVESWAL
jgi:hypothetical protein